MNITIAFDRIIEGSKVATSPNTVHTLQASPSPFGTLLPIVETLYILETLSANRKERV